MKLVTFNINGIRARLPRLLEYLGREQPDIACLLPASWSIWAGSSPT